MQKAIGLLAMSAFILGATSTQRIEKREPPTVTMHTDRLSKDGVRCGRDAPVPTSRSAPPDGARKIVRLRVTAKRPIGIHIFEHALASRAARHCADGLSVVQATATDGADGFIEVIGVAWERAAEKTVPPEKAPEPTPTDQPAPW